MFMYVFHKCLNVQIFKIFKLNISKAPSQACPTTSIHATIR